ncbi:MAG: heavy metal translocating P-type ATPase [Anaerolineales bacterium]
MAAQTYPITGMDCADCARTIEKGVSQLPGVHSAACDFATAKLRVSGAVTADTIRQRVEALGYGLAQSAIRNQKSEIKIPLLGFLTYLLSRTDTRLALLGSVGIIIAWLGSLVGISPITNNVLLVISLLVTGYPIARSGLNALIINRDFNINLLMTIAAVGAVIISEPLEAATLMVLFVLAEALEGYTTDRARDSLRGLVALAPAQAIRLRDAHEETVPVESLNAGDVIVIRPGDRIPMDGIVLTGNSEVNQSAITGESIPVQKALGSQVFAGTVNGSGALEVRVTHLAADNTLSRIIHLVEEAQSHRAPSQRFIDQFARVYTPAVVGLAVLVAAVPPLFFGQPFFDTATEHGWLYRALALLVTACPCALVISAPVTLVSALTAAARRGVLIKGGAHLESLAQVRAFAFDKTGTLTLGEPHVTAARALGCATASGLSEPCEMCDDVLALASALERRSTHPLARAVLTAAEQRGLDNVYAPAENVTAFAGRGLQGNVNGKLATLGNHGLFDAEHPHTEAFCREVEAAEANGQTTMLLCDGDQVRGFIAVADAVRAESRAAIAELNALGCATVMLTGDNETVARAVGAAVGVADVRAGLLPEQKFAAVTALRAQHGRVAMVGDGINDTPALAAADVGIAVGGASHGSAAASAQAIETADIVLMADGLRQLPYAARLAPFTRRLIFGNIAFSLVTKLVFVVLALFGWSELWMAVVADMGVSLLVTLNGMRPLTFEEKVAVKS